MSWVYQKVVVGHISEVVVLTRSSDMPRAPRFWGPRAFGGPALTLLYFFRIFLFPVSARGPKEPKSPRKREAPKSKSKAPKSGAQNDFFPCFCFSVFSVSAYSVFQRGAPKSPEYVRPQDLKIDTVERCLKQSPNSAGPQESGK